MIYQLLAVSFTLITCGAEELFTCVRNENEMTPTSGATPERVQTGLPGRRGPEGREGARGISGVKGSKGDPGIPDNSQINSLRTELNSLRQQFENARTEIASNEGDLASLRQQIQSIQGSINNALIRGYMELKDGWVAPFNGYQYKVTPARQSWDESRAICRRWGGDLVVHGVQDSGTKIKIRQAQSFNGNYWIGLSDKIIEGAWGWVNGDQSLTNDNMVWRSDQPDGGTIQDCAFINAFQVGLQAIDTTCSDRRFALCEKPI